jgi:hypothetical protein
MSKSFSLLFLGSISSIVLSSMASAQAPNATVANATVANAAVPNVEGTWKMSKNGDNIAPTYTLIQKGNALTGTFKGPMGNLPLTGTVTNDKKVTFSVKFRGMSLKFAGTVDGQIMKGVADTPRGRKNWTATK